MTWTDEQVTEFLNSVPDVRWDRFIEDHDGVEGAIAVYGWKPRDDGRADFFLYRFAPGNDSAWFTTSSVELSARHGDDEHHECQRVADRFNGVYNAVRDTDPKTTGVVVTTTDLANGDSETQVLPPNGYVLVVGENMRLDSEINHANGTRLLTLKRREGDDRG